MTKPESETHIRAILDAVPADVDSAAYTVFVKGETKAENFSCAGTRDRLGVVRAIVHPPNIPVKTVKQVTDNAPEVLPAPEQPQLPAA